jgi:hypothetical protein
VTSGFVLADLLSNDQKGHAFFLLCLFLGWFLLLTIIPKMIIYLNKNNPRVCDKLK